MSTATANYAHESHSVQNTASRRDRVVNVLWLTYSLVPVIAGADKFTNLLVNWDQYLSPTVANLLPFSPHSFMLVVGIIEIIAGILVFVRPAIGSIVVALWLVCIALNLLLTGQYFDVAVRDIVMAVGAWSFYSLNTESRS